MRAIVDSRTSSVVDESSPAVRELVVD